MTMNRVILTLALLAGCTAQQDAEVAQAVAVVKLVAPFLPNGQAVLAAGQLVCGGVAIFDQATGLPYLVTGKAGAVVQAVCGAAGTGAPGPAPADATLNAKAVTLPAGA